jgi:hypothetical protein
MILMRAIFSTASGKPAPEKNRYAASVLHITEAIAARSASPHNRATIHC